MRASSQRGFTLVEVMISLAILAGSLTVLLRSVARNITRVTEAESLTVVTNLARAKLNEIEEQLIQDGFLETDQSSEGDFGDQGWPDITWTAKVEQVEIPSFDTLQAMQNAQAAAGSGAGSGSGGAQGGFENSALGGMLGLLGGSSDAAGAAGGSFIQQQFQLVQQVLESSIRKVTLTIKWQTINRENVLPVVAYFTDPAGMNKVIGSLGLDAPASDPNANPNPNPNPNPTPGPTK